MKTEEGKLEWFNGNQDALDLFRMFVDVAHIWDDMIDRDKNVTNEDINYVFYLAFVAIPQNKIYQLHFAALSPLLLNGFVGYMVANKYEKSKDEHGLEISHTLRYSVAQVFIYLITVLNGVGKAQDILEDALKFMVPERYHDYLREHKNET